LAYLPTSRPQIERIELRPQRRFRLPWYAHAGHVRSATSARSAMLCAVLVAAALSMGGTSGTAFASDGCGAVNMGGFNVSAGAFGTKTIGGFAVGDRLTFIIASSSSGSWILRTAGFNNLDGSPIFATTGSQTRSYTVTGGSQDTTLTQYTGGITVTASCAAVPVAPTVNSISPASGPATGGSNVTISGTGFTDVTAVGFGGNTASHIVNSDTSITATLPAGIGTVDVTVTTAAGTSTVNPTDQFTYIAAPAAPPVAASAPAPSPVAVAPGAPPVIAPSAAWPVSIVILPRPDPRRRPPRSGAKPILPIVPRPTAHISPTLQR
jgi:IPT/TIG domain